MSSSEQEANVTQRWRFDLAYDGAGLYGFAHQPALVTVTGLLRTTLRDMLRLETDPVIIGAGRTDTGVHAFAQVIHVDLPDPLFRDSRAPDEDRIARALNLQLRGQIRITKAQKVNDTFHARFSAQWREYRYLVLETTPPALALHDAWSWAVTGPLDIDAMNRACEAILGTHDFRAFCRRPVDKTPDEPLHRHVLSAQWERLVDTWQMSPERAPVARFTIRAGSFCHNMVRSLTSTFVAIGQGRLPESEVASRLESHQRLHLPAPAPAAGLSLVGVGYDEFAGGPSGFVG